MNRSENIAELAAALAQAQGEMHGAEKDAVNTFYGGNRYATLGSIWEACRGALSANGLSVVQTPECVTADGDKLIVRVVIETVLFHSSGQWIANTLVMPVEKLTAQGVGSAITYGRRYALAAMVGVAPGDDDDGVAVSRPGKPSAKVPDEMDQLISECRQSIATAQTLERLDEIAKSLANMPDIVKQECRQLYSVRRGQLQRRVDSEAKEGVEA